MKFKKKVVFAQMAVILFIIALFISCIDLLSFHMEFYEYEFEQANTAENIGMEESDLYASMDVLLDYIKGDVDSLEIYYDVQGVERLIYSEDEISHMEDVRNLYRVAIIVRNGALVALLLFIVILYVDKKQEFIEVLTTGYRRMFTLFLFLISALLIYASIDFTSVWFKFHELVFTNDLWLMDANTSLMIQMLEEKVFFDLVFLVFGVFSVISMFLYIFSFYYKRRLIKKYKKLESMKTTS